MEGFVKVLIASGCAALSGGLNVWMVLRDKKTPTIKDVVTAFVSPILMVVSTCTLFM